MNHYVPDFEVNQDDSIPTSSSGFGHHHHKSNLQDDDEDGLMEMLWSNGPMERSLKKMRTPNLESTGRMTSTSASAFASTAMNDTHTHQQPQLFMQEDEMASWLHYSLEEEEHFGGSDLVYPAPAVNYPATSTQSNKGVVTQIGEDRPPIPPSRRAEVQASSNFSLFQPFARLSRARGEAARESPEIEVELQQILELNGRDQGLVNRNAHLDAAEQERDRETFTFDLTAMTSSSGVSGDPSEKKGNNDQKRKAREEEDEDQEEEDAKFETSDTKKRTRGSTSTKRSRAAEVHNLSERRRRDRINEKMKALQELIPRCNKSDKASMLDEAIEYLKSLQMQVQMMSMGCSMVPMVFAGGQPYMAPLGMGMNVGMGMDMSRPVMAFPHVAGSSMPRPVAAADMGPRLPIPAYHPPAGSAVDFSRMGPNQSDPSFNPYGIRSVNAVPVPYADSYHRYFSHYMQAHPCPPPQVHTVASTSMAEASTSMAEASTSKVESGENPKLD